MKLFTDIQETDIQETELKRKIAERDKRIEKGVIAIKKAEQITNKQSTNFLNINPRLSRKGRV